MLTSDRKTTWTVKLAICIYMLTHDRRQNARHTHWWDDGMATANILRFQSTMTAVFSTALCSVHACDFRHARGMFRSQQWFCITALLASRCVWSLARFWQQCTWTISASVCGATSLTRSCAVSQCSEAHPNRFSKRSLLVMALRVTSWCLSLNR